MAPLFWLLMIVTTVYGSEKFIVGGQADNEEEKTTNEKLFSRRADFDDLDLDLDLTAEESANVPDDQPEARYRNPFPYAFNGGKPFSLLKDPITGQIDFEKAPPLKAVNFTDQYEDIDDTNDEETGKHVEAYLNQKTIKGKNGIAIGPNEINPFSPSFHDFLNLPVQYSSDKYGKDKYPLISSSYANTKVQSGSNLYSTYNHRPYHESTTRATNIVTRRAYTTTELKTEPTTTTTTTTTTSTTTTTTTEAPTTTTTTTEKITSPEPPVTTWKPKTSSRYEEYDDILPIEKLQTPKYDNEVSTKPIVDYIYEDYEEENQYSSPKEEITSPISLKSETNFSTTSTPEIIIETTKSQQLVTSMPINSMDTEKNSQFSESEIPVISGHVHFPNIHSNRPMLPESTSNIVIPPDQDTVSFVLGNRQNVDGSYYSHSSGENTYSGIIGEGSFRPLISSSDQTSSANKRPISIFNFPQLSESNDPIPNAPITSSLIPNSPVSFPNSNHSQNEIDSRPHSENSDNSQNLSEDYKNGYIVFPGPSRNQDIKRPVEEHVVIINEADGTIQEFTTTSTISPLDSVTKNNGPPLPSEDLTPPMERPRPRPPFYFHYQQLPTARPEFSRPSRLPMRQKPESMHFKRRPVTPDTKLPNILPQFRPNAKASHGHRGAETIGTLPAQIYHNRPRPPPPSSSSSYSRRPSPSFLQRLSPPPPSHRGNNHPKVENSEQIGIKRIHHSQGNLPIRDKHFPVNLGKFQLFSRADKN